MNPALIYWWRKSLHRGNFGDELGPLLLERFTGIKPTFMPITEAELVTVGSIIGLIPDEWTGTVFGTGTLDRDSCSDLSAARVLAVRGEFTRQLCGLPAATPIGSPAILAPSLLAKRPRQTIDVGIVPHYRDSQMPKRHPGAYFIDVLDPPMSVLTAIARCGFIVTSSLHGLVAADALGIPHVLEPSPRVTGGLWKFQDYASALGETVLPYTERLTDRAAMAEKQAEMMRLWMSLREEAA
jgi:pyruvyltransferase